MEVVRRYDRGDQDKATDDDRIALARQFLTGLRTHDWDMLQAIMTDDVIWTLPGEARIPGKAQGIKAVLERARRIAGDGFGLTLSRVLVGQYSIALALHCATDRGPPGLDEYLKTVCILRDGRIAAIHCFRGRRNNTHPISPLLTEAPS